MCRIIACVQRCKRAIARLLRGRPELVPCQSTHVIQLLSVSPLGVVCIMTSIAWHSRNPWLLIPPRLIVPWYKGRYLRESNGRNIFVFSKRWDKKWHLMTHVGITYVWTSYWATLPPPRPPELLFNKSLFGETGGLKGSDVSLPSLSLSLFLFGPLSFCKRVVCACNVLIFNVIADVIFDVTLPVKEEFSYSRLKKWILFLSKHKWNVQRFRGKSIFSRDKIDA